MADVTDILTDPETGDLLAANGDFIIGDATIHHQSDLLQAKEGEYKQYPTTGVGLDTFLNDEDSTDMLRKIRIQFTQDGMTISDLINSNGLKIRAQYP